MTRHRPRTDMLRQAIAREAARLMIEHATRLRDRESKAAYVRLTDLAACCQEHRDEQASRAPAPVRPDVHANDVTRCAARPLGDAPVRDSSASGRGAADGTSTAHNDHADLFATRGKRRRASDDRSIRTKSATPLRVQPREVEAYPVVRFNAAATACTLPSFRSTASPGASGPCGVRRCGAHRRGSRPARAVE